MDFPKKLLDQGLAPFSSTWHISAHTSFSISVLSLYLSFFSTDISVLLRTLHMQRPRAAAAVEAAADHHFLVLFRLPMHAIVLVRPE
jgi:hypothetical protein